MARVSLKIDLAVDKVLHLLGILHIFISPFTKVEESFNIQAMHDILFHGTDLDSYDHHEFPGVVPRTFLGPLVVSGYAFPVVTVLRALGFSKLYLQIAVRSVLSILVIYALNSYRAAVRRRLGPDPSLWLGLLTCSQFHLLFYASRPLPNVFALVIVLHALAAWLSSKPSRFVFLSAAAILIFRVELVIFLGLIVVMELVSRNLSFTQLIATGLVSLLVWIPVTVLVDSYFWRRMLWPEFEVMYFNVVLNKSSEWGVMPFAWYFYSALPRALMSASILVAAALLLDRRSILFLFPALGFIFLYSFLPHKELRFIIYTIPVLNTAAALVLHHIWTNRIRGSNWLVRWASCLLPPLLLAANLAATAGLTYISSLNYPGGLAMRALHTLEDSESPVVVHLDVAACQTGISRFTQENSNWEYHKTEDLTPQDLIEGNFTHLIVAAQNQFSLDLKPLRGDFDILADVPSYAGLQIDPSKFPPVQVTTKPALFILKRRRPGGRRVDEALGS